MFRFKRQNSSTIDKTKVVCSICQAECSYHLNAEVFNRGSATPRGSAEVLQGVRQIISSEAFFSLFQNCKTSKRLHKHKQNVKIAFYSLKITHRLPMSLHAII